MSLTVQIGGVQLPKGFIFRWQRKKGILGHRSTGSYIDSSLIQLTCGKMTIRSQDLICAICGAYSPKHFLQQTLLFGEISSWGGVKERKNWRICGGMLLTRLARSCGIFENGAKNLLTMVNAKPFSNTWDFSGIMLLSIIIMICWNFWGEAYAGRTRCTHGVHIWGTERGAPMPTWSYPCVCWAYGDQI